MYTKQDPPNKDINQSILTVAKEKRIMTSQNYLRA
jgi:hypothetical protein